MRHQRKQVILGTFFSLLIILQSTHVLGERYHDLDQYGSLVCRSESSCHVSIANDTEVVREKRAVVALLVGASIIVSLANIGFDIYLQIKGCAGLYPSITKFVDDIETARSDLLELSDKMNDEYTRSKNLLEYMKASNRLNQDIWFHVWRIMELTEMVFEDLDPQVINKLMEQSLYLKREIQKRNQTLEQMDFNAISAEYNGIFSSVKNAMFGLAPIVGEVGLLAVTQGFKWYRTSKIAKDLKTNSAVLVNINSKRRAVLGANNVKNSIQAGAATNAKALSTTSTLSKLAKGFSVLTSVVSIGLEIYMAVQKIKACKAQRDQLMAARDQLQPEVQVFNDTLKEVKSHHESLKDEYATVKHQITSDIFFEYLSNITHLAKSGHNTDSLLLAAEEVKNFESKIEDADEPQTIALQENLVDALSKFTFTWSCYHTQVKIISYVAKKCEIGFGAMRTLYEQAIKHFVLIDDCTSVVGEAYTTYEKTKAYAETQMELNKLSSDCLLNNPDLFEITCNLNAKGWDIDYISEETGLNSDQINELLPKCPPQPLSPRDKRVICRMKSYDETLADIKKYYPYYNQEELTSVYNSCSV